MSYDAALRRDTPLALELRARIAAAGPMSVHDYMGACLNDPAHGYYRTRRAIGGGGDFITAPEISQVFGELIGLWAAVTWQQMGSPSAVQLVELGPGRGTMMADALRATRRVPGFVDAARIQLVEPSPVLAAVQREALAGCGREVAWVDDLADVESGPTILLANEVLDVLPVRQVLRADDGWRERCVGLDADGGLAFAAGDAVSGDVIPQGLAASAAPGAICEVRDLGSVAAQLRRLAEGGPLAALVIDYGHAENALGDTLQAVRGHAYEHPLASPGEADLTAQVDFGAAALAMRAAGLVVEHLTTQAEFLGALGIAERASRLMSANPRRTQEIETGVLRLMAPQGMGTRFKVLGVRSAGAADGRR